MKSSTSSKAWVLGPKAENQEIFEKMLLEAFEDAHPLIKDKIASGEGIRGQFVDSQVAKQVMLKGMEIDLCILPMHDGFIMIKQHADVLEGLMHEAIMEVIGHTEVDPEFGTVA